jgi:hypothetical protein
MFVLGPNDNKVRDSKSDATDARFGGARQVTGGIQKAEDYTKRTMSEKDFVENPDATMDIDDLNDPRSRKDDTTRQVKSFEAGDLNTEHFHVSDLENKPLDEGREDSAFQKPDANEPHGPLHPFNPFFVDVTGIDDEGN